MSGTAPIYIFATLDTKLDEAIFLADAIRDEGATAVLVDIGTRAARPGSADVGRDAVAAFHPGGVEAVLAHDDRGAAVMAMSEALRAFMIDAHRAGRFAGAIGLGGTGGTSMIANAMRGLPIGLPKLMVSTVASGDTSNYIGTSDITMMFSVVDVAGLNRVSRQIYRNAAAAIAGMARSRRVADDGKPAVGITMFGVTTRCVTQVRDLLGEDHDQLVFHATGVGGRAMEELVASRMIDAVLDITTTEVADEVVGGVFAAGPARFDATLARRLPYVMSVGAMDMVNFGPADSVPARFAGRRFHVHNATVTLMRTTVEENIAGARWIAAKLNAHPDAPFTILLPEGGVSELDKPGNPFHDPQADAALFDELERAVTQSATRRIVRYPHHINDPAFAGVIVHEFRKALA